MKKIRYAIAMSLDGYIAGPNGEFDWIVVDPELDFAALWGQFDTLLMGRRTWDVARKRMGEPAFASVKTVVVSRTLQPADNPQISIVPELTEQSIEALRNQSRKDIWLFGGGELFRHLLHMGQVDTVEVSVVPVLLGGGRALLPAPANRTKLKLASHKVYRSGLVSLIYDVRP